MTVVCAIPLQIPVHRMRVTVRCRELGTALHRTVERLGTHARADTELIAAVTGLPLTQIARVQGELSRALAPIEREYVLWVDHARSRCLPYSALDGVVTVRRRDGGLTLPLEPPTATDLERIGLDAAASWEAGVDGHVEIAEILDVAADARGGSGGGPASHVLRLPDTQSCSSTSTRRTPTSPASPSPSTPRRTPNSPTGCIRTTATPHYPTRLTCDTSPKPARSRHPGWRPSSPARRPSASAPGASPSRTPGTSATRSPMSPRPRRAAWTCAPPTSRACPNGCRASSPTPQSVASR